jgi:hypothetical protein
VRFLAAVLVERRKRFAVASLLNEAMTERPRGHGRRQRGRYWPGARLRSAVSVPVVRPAKANCVDY